MLKSFWLFCFVLISLTSDLSAERYYLQLRDNLQNAEPGDYIVTAQGKNYSLLHIYSKTDQTLTIEEISIPASKIPKSNFSWSTWIMNQAPGHTSWVLYTLDLNSGNFIHFYALTRGKWYEMTPPDNFLSMLLNVRFDFIPPDQRRRIGITLRTGPYDKRPYWEPHMVVNGQTVEGVRFDAWRTTWPKDGSELAGKTIEVYLPEEGLNYPAYFPYWLQISGVIGSAKIRIVDSGTGLTSPQTLTFFPRNL